MTAEIVRVNLGPRSYEIEVGSGNLPSLGGFVRQRGEVTHAVVITDSNLEPHATTAEQSLTAAGVRCHSLVVPAGENSKSIDQANRLWNELIALGADRKTVVVAIGGGVVGDLAGFIAATFGRGLRFVQVPTSLLAQVDSSVGGKVGVNLPAAKNMVGAFWQPLGVLIDTLTLNSLPDREYRSGLAEVVKYGVILDAHFFADLESHVAEIERRDAKTLQRIIAHCCRLKASVVEQDEREETGIRAVLNYGHTFAHALENVLSYGALLHGEAVSIGMTCASNLSTALGRTSAEFAERQRALLTAMGLPVVTPQVDEGAIVAAMGRDKKVEHGLLRFVLPTRMGHVDLVGGISTDQMLAAMR